MPVNALDAVIAARDLLSTVTPLKRDCGRSCGGACCQSDEDGQGGMLLFPGEERLYAVLPPGFSLERNDQVLPGAMLLNCGGVCRRADRPLSCRLFPLLPGKNGPVLDRRGWAVCPLMESGLRGLDPDFVRAAEAAGRILYACPEHERFLTALHDFNRRLSDF